MPRVDLTLTIPIERTARVLQLEGMFDVPAAEKSRVEFHFDVPLHERPWNVGLIVGPSGAGKSTVARHLFSDNIVKEYEWHPTRSLVDGFAPLGIQETTASLASVGFSTPPNWLRPFHVLSNGEQFRATMARAIVDERPLVVVDEFTSVIDRQVAQVGSHAVQKAIRSRGKQFVAVTCHYDVMEWLQPDWVLEPHLGQFAWRSLQRRPPLELEIVRCDHSSWRWFAPFHYLSADLHKSARCLVGLIGGEPAAFAGLMFMPHPKVKDIMSLSRLVVRPDFQGLGLGAYAFTEAVARICRANGYRMVTHPSHPSLIKPWAASSLWRMTSAPSLSSGRSKKSTLAKSVTIGEKSMGRRVAHFVYAGPDFETEEECKMARQLWA